ncbi:hypothetical protein Tco_1489469, partial [Tanacetum coccineum]
KFGEFLENKESVEEVVVGGGEALGVGEDDDTGNVATDGEVQYYVYTLHVHIPFLKNLNDKYVKMKKMKAAIQKRLWDLRIQDEGVESVTPVLQEDGRPKRPQREKSKPAWQEDYVM